MDVQKEHKKSLSYLNVIVLVLSFYVLGSLIVDTFFKLPPQASRLLELLDNSICVVFLFDFCYHFYHAENKLKYMRWGWIDLVSSIPTFPLLRFGRIFRLIRLIRILRAFRSVRYLLNHFFLRKAHGTFATVSAIAIVVVIFSSIAILQVEDDPNSNIKTAEDAIWWAWVTVTTVGYGDKFPVTTEGRLIASALITTGVGLFGTFAGFVASWFLEERKDEDAGTVNNSNFVALEIEKLFELMQKGAITREEYLAQKERLLGGG